MTDLADARAIIQEEETDFRSAVSEALLTKVGQVSNFIVNRQIFYYNFNLNGAYSNAAGQEGLEGFLMPVFDYEIMSIGINNIVPGISGTTTVDIHRIDNGGTDQGSIFDIKPSIDSTAGTNSYAIRRYLPSVVDVVTSTGVTMPTFLLGNTDFNAGDAMRFDVDTTMVQAQNFSVTIGYRPR